MGNLLDALPGVIMLTSNMYVLSCLLAGLVIMSRIRRYLVAGCGCWGRLCCPSWIILNVGLGY